MAIEWNKVGKFAEEHWPYMAIGGVVLVGLFYSTGMFSGSSTGGTVATTSSLTPSATTTPDPNLTAELAYATGQQNAQTAQQQIAAQQNIAAITAQMQTQIAAITAAAQTTQNQANDTSAAYIKGLSAQSNIAGYSLAATQAQNAQYDQALAGGFQSFALASASEAQSAATGAAGIAAQNDQAAGNTIGKTLGGIANIIGAVNGTNFASGLTRVFTGSAPSMGVSGGIATSSPMSPSAVNANIQSNALLSQGIY